MLNIFITTFGYYLLKLFQITKFSFFYIKYIYLLSSHLTHILILLKNHSFSINDKPLILKLKYLIKYNFLNKTSYYKFFKYNNLQELRTSCLVITSSNVNTYLLQKNFSFYYKSFYIKLKQFTIFLNWRKLLFVMFSLKLILFNLYCYNIRLMVWGTPEFKDEITSINEIFNITNFDYTSISLLLQKNLFSSNSTYNLKIHMFFRNFSKIIKRNIVFITLQNTGNAAFILQRFRYFSFGCLTNLKLKHTYSFLVPIHIKYNFSKFFMYSLILSYKNLAHKYLLVFFILYFQKRKILINLYSH